MFSCVPDEQWVEFLKMRKKLQPRCAHGIVATSWSIEGTKKIEFGGLLLDVILAYVIACHSGVPYIGQPWVGANPEYLDANWPLKNCPSSIPDYDEPRIRLEAGCSTKEMLFYDAKSLTLSRHLYVPQFATELVAVERVCFEDAWG